MSPPSSPIYQPPTHLLTSPGASSANVVAQPRITERSCGCDDMTECHPARLELGDVWDCPTHLYIMTVMDKGSNATLGNRMREKRKG